MDSEVATEAEEVEVEVAMETGEGEEVAEVATGVQDKSLSQNGLKLYDYLVNH